VVTITVDGDVSPAPRTRPRRIAAPFEVVVPARVDALVRHTRTRPVRHDFRYRTPQWLVDLAEPNAAFPRWARPLASIRDADHFAPDDERPLLTKVRRFVDAQSTGWTAARVLMLTNAASVGYVFDPITVYFVFDAAGSVEGVLAEVHNTYGERHCYVLRPDEAGRSNVTKEFYVSPFFEVSGGYEIRTRLAPRRVGVTITLKQGDETVFVASVDGALRPASRGAVARAMLRWPLAPQRVSALIRGQGIRLWMRRLPIRRRPVHEPPAGMR
jgi:DUF1365 family protein